VPLASSFCVPSGPLDAACFEWLVDDLVERLRAAGPLDGVYLALHGSMQVDSLGEAPEAVIIRRTREVVGSSAQIAVSYDLHANLSPGTVDPVDVMIGYRTNPHWDLAPTGFRAGNRLIRSLRGQIRPTHAWRKLPIVLGGGVGIDFLAPMNEVYRWMKRLERRDPRVLSASLFMVHPYTDAEDLGWAAHVCTDGDPALADELADDLADRAYAKREVPLPPMLDPEEAFEAASASPWRRLGPVTLVDVDDIVGAGAPGGNTQIARALLERDRGLRAYVPIHDPAAVTQSWDAPLGSTIALTLRGTPGYGMPEVELPEAVVAAKTDGDFGRIVRLDVGDVHLAVGERAPLPIHPKFWRAIDLPPRDADIIVQKNFFHYRMFYAAISFDHLPVVTRGATRFDRVRAREHRVPVYPGANPPDWREADRVLRGLDAGPGPQTSPRAG